MPRLGLQRATEGVLRGETSAQALLRWGVQAFKVFSTRRSDLERDVAVTVGAQAARLGMTEKELSSWLQGAYSSLWVKQTNLQPKYDMKAIRKLVFDAYHRAQEKGPSR